LGTIAAGNYEQTITLNPGTGTAIYIPPGVGCYVTVSYGWSIFNSAGVEVDSGGGSGKSRSSFVGNTSAISVPWSSTTYLESLSFPTTDTYSIRSYYKISINYTAGSGTVEVRALTTGTATASFNKINNYTEITEQGMQVVSSVSRYVRMSTNQSTDVDALYVNGSFTATDKNFKITHPLDENKWLLHSSIEGPRVDNLYRGMVTLLNGFAKINLDEISNMTEGTWLKLNREPQFFLQNMNGWDRVKGEIINNELFIYSENSDSTDLISYMVIGERQDDGIKQSGFTNNDGRLITEILK
jgi:hypothetical protein